MTKALYFSRLVQPVLIAAVLLLSTSLGSGAQLQTQSPHPGARHPISGSDDDDNTWQQQQQKELAKKANVQREEEIKKDAEKLLELATELKQSVDKSNENTLSLDVIKKAEQIEKLAKNVKEKMKGP